MSAARRDLTITVAGYLALEAASPGLRYEYLDGQLVMMSGGSVNHSLICSETIAFFIGVLRGTTCRVFTSDARVKLSETRYVYPDVTIKCAAGRTDAQNVTDPTVVIEVLSPGTATYDRTEKLQRYRECPSLQAILLVEQEPQIVEVNRRQSEQVWTVQTYGMDDEIVLDAIGVTIPVAAIYASIDSEI